jgi:hypothetical protein
MNNNNPVAIHVSEHDVNPTCSISIATIRQNIIDIQTRGKEQIRMLQDTIRLQNSMIQSIEKPMISSVKLYKDWLEDLNLDHDELSSIGQPYHETIILNTTKEEPEDPIFNVLVRKEASRQNKVNNKWVFLHYKSLVIYQNVISKLSPKFYCVQQLNKNTYIFAEFEKSLKAESTNMFKSGSDIPLIYSCDKNKVDTVLVFFVIHFSKTSD